MLRIIFTIENYKSIIFFKKMIFWGNQGKTSFQNQFRTQFICGEVFHASSTLHFRMLSDHFHRPYNYIKDVQIIFCGRIKD